jgi:hypothetical protein
MCIGYNMADVDESFLLSEKKDKYLVDLPNGEYYDSDETILGGKQNQNKPIITEYKFKNDSGVLSENANTLVSYFNDFYSKNVERSEQKIDDLVLDPYTMLYIGSFTVVGLYMLFRAGAKM